MARLKCYRVENTIKGHSGVGGTNVWTDDRRLTRKEAQRLVASVFKVKPEDVKVLGISPN